MRNPSSDSIDEIHLPLDILLLSLRVLLKTMWGGGGGKTKNTSWMGRWNCSSDAKGCDNPIDVKAGGRLDTFRNRRRRDSPLVFFFSLVL